MTLKIYDNFCILKYMITFALFSVLPAQAEHGHAPCFI